MKPRFPGKKGKKFLTKTKVLDESCCHVLNMLQFFNHINTVFEQKDHPDPNKRVRSAVHETVDYFLKEGHTDFLKNFQKFPFEDKNIEFDGSKPLEENMSSNASKKNFSELAKALQGGCSHCKGLISCVQHGLNIVYDNSNASLDSFVMGASWNCCPSSAPPTIISEAAPIVPKNECLTPGYESSIPIAQQPETKHETIRHRLAQFRPGTYLLREERSVNGFRARPGNWPAY